MQSALVILQHTLAHVLDLDQAGQENEDGTADAGNVLVIGVSSIAHDLAFTVESGNQTSGSFVVQFVDLGFVIICKHVSRQKLDAKKKNANSFIRKGNHLSLMKMDTEKFCSSSM